MSNLRAEILIESIISYSMSEAFEKLVFAFRLRKEYFVRGPAAFHIAIYRKVEIE